MATENKDKAVVLGESGYETQPLPYELARDPCQYIIIPQKLFTSTDLHNHCGPGSGKGTQCSMIAEHYGFFHLSAGELLQKEVDSGSENKEMIECYRMEGKLLPSGMVIKLLQKAMEKSQTKRFLIDGFPRNKENLGAAEDIMKIEPELVLLIECSGEVLISRLLNRNQGRADDNRETIEKRLKVYHESTLPLIDYYSSKGKLCKVDGEASKEKVFESIKKFLCKLNLRDEE
ncbi:Uridylate kinase/adenylate kinase [Handroanthus impetiginosus]|uniref:adenylate kinase n=1 Tax=Handroanthus impetiginosus TaxID=429701 RepID=A0A2G9G917_9LAMI|nr:Uridylate kinase/adenylate kinase [Handroanthus impetiginosus]